MLDKNSSGQGGVAVLDEDGQAPPYASVQQWESWNDLENIKTLSPISLFGIVTYE